MSKKAASRTTVLLDNPLEGEELLLDAMYGVATAAPRRPQAIVRAPLERPAQKPQHYKIVSISLYTEDIERLERMVGELKRRGHYKANKSQLIRHALAQLDLDNVPGDDEVPQSAGASVRSLTE